MTFSRKGCRVFLENLHQHVFVTTLRHLVITLFCLNHGNDPAYNIIEYIDEAEIGILKIDHFKGVSGKRTEENVFVMVFPEPTSPVRVPYSCFCR